MTSTETEIEALSQMAPAADCTSKPMRCEIAFSTEDIGRGNFGELERMAKIIHPWEVTMPMPEVTPMDSDLHRDRMLRLAKSIGAVVKLIRHGKSDEFGQWSYFAGWAMFKCFRL